MRPTVQWPAHLKVLHLLVCHELVDEGDQGLAGELLVQEGAESGEGVPVVEMTTCLTNVHVRGAVSLSHAHILKVVPHVLRLVRFELFKGVKSLELLKQWHQLLVLLSPPLRPLLLCSAILLLLPQLGVEGQPVAPVSHPHHAALVQVVVVDLLGGLDVLVQLVEAPGEEGHSSLRRQPGPGQLQPLHARVKVTPFDCCHAYLVQLLPRQLVRALNLNINIIITDKRRLYFLCPTHLDPAVLHGAGAELGDVEVVVLLQQEHAIGRPLPVLLGGQTGQAGVQALAQGLNTLQ